MPAGHLPGLLSKILNASRRPEGENGETFENKNEKGQTKANQTIQINLN
jgi:hypothetical protein